MTKACKRVVIVGGGSAGWLTSSVLAAHLDCLTPQGMSITLIEAPGIPTIGVGEGTWPSMQTTLKSIGISEREFIRECDASFKQGSKFIGWKQPGNENYYHPFSLPLGFPHLDCGKLLAQGNASQPFAHCVTPQAAVCDAGLAPKQIATPDYAHVVNYGYHLDAGKFSTLLKRHAVQKLGVTHISDQVVDVKLSATGDIESVLTECNGEIQGDLFIDCSGSRGLLIGKHLGVKFNDISKQLFNDTALATQLPYIDSNNNIASTTNATAQKHGWIWDIGLPTRKGIGYTYCSALCNDQEAEATLRRYATEFIGHAQAEKLTLRKIAFNPGHREQFWHNNCLAVGMSSGFVEPLEATALVLVEQSAKMLAEQFPANREIMDIVAKRLNTRFTRHWEDITDFLKLHYVLSQREDSDYWKEHRCRTSISERLQEKMQLWQSQSPSIHDEFMVDELFPSASYQYIYFGMRGTTHLQNAVIPTNITADLQQFDALSKNMISMQAQYLSALPTTRTLINAIKQ